MKRVDLVTGRQALVTCCHFVVDDALTHIYPWFAALPEEDDDDINAARTSSAGPNGSHKAAAAPHAESLKKLNLRLRRLVHQGLADMIDPARYFCGYLKF